MPTRQEEQLEHWRNEKMLRGVRKDAPRGPKEDRVRRRDWLPEDLDDLESWDEIDAPQFERVMPRGEAERRRQNLARAQTTLRSVADAERAEGPLARASSAEGVEGRPGAPRDGAAPSPAPAEDDPQAAGWVPNPTSLRDAAPPEGSEGRPRVSSAGAALPSPAPAAGQARRAGVPQQPPAGPPTNGRPAPAGPGRPGWRPPACVPAARPALVRPGTSTPVAPQNGARSAAVAYGGGLSGSHVHAGGSQLLEGLVVEVATGLCRVDSGDGVRLCTLRSALTDADTGLTNAVAVGDRVILRPDGADRGLVEAVLPRRSLLARPDVARGHLRQPIAANADQLLVVAAWRDPAFWPELVDRYLVTAAAAGLQPIIAVNKIDLAADLAEARAALRPYMALAYRVIFTSARSGQGVAELRAALAGHMTVLAGLSGVGKSSLLSAVQPGLHLRAAEVSDHWHQGRHTTTQASLHRLQNGGYVIDTPGIREFGLAGLRRGDLAAYYPELAPLAGKCRFADCTHQAEPGCAVQAALRQGRIAPVRFDSYQKIYATLPA